MDASARPGSFLIVGCQRSGTTLLRLILDSHPDVYCFDEHLGEEHFQHGRHAELIPPGKRHVGHKLPVWTECLADRRLSEPLNYRGEPILFLVRDVREVVASMFGLGRAWVATEIPSRLATACRSGIPHAPMLNAEARRALDSPQALTVIAAVYWKMKTLALFDMLAANLPVLPVNYRSLVCYPEATLRRVTEFLNIPWRDELLDHGSSPHDELIGKTALGNTDAARQIDQASLNLWQERLTPEEQSAILGSAGRLNDLVRGLGAVIPTGPTPHRQLLGSKLRSRVARWRNRGREIWKTEGMWAAARRALRKVARELAGSPARAAAQPTISAVDLPADEFHLLFPQ